jgi:hypothetical protein
VKGVGIIDRLDQYYGRDATQRTQVYYWIIEAKSGRHDLANVPPPRSAPDEGVDERIAKSLREILHLLTRKIAKALSISSTTVRKHLNKSLGMKCYHMRWVPHTSTAAQKPKVRRWLEPSYKRWRVMQPPISTSCGLVMSRGCPIGAITKQCGQHRRRQWTNLSGHQEVIRHRAHWMVDRRMLRTSGKSLDSYRTCTGFLH